MIIISAPSPSVWVTISTQDMQETISLNRESTSNELHLKVSHEAKVFGQLVVLGFDVTVFTPAPYQRHRL